VLETAESFRKLVSDKRFFKQKDFALNSHSMFTHTCAWVNFLRWSKSNLKTAIEWQTKHWTIPLALVLIKERYCQGSLDHRHPTDRDWQ